MIPGDGNEKLCLGYSSKGYCFLSISDNNEWPLSNGGYDEPSFNNGDYDMRFLSSGD